jgi:hypothetical protein
MLPFLLPDLLPEQLPTLPWQLILAEAREVTKHIVCAHTFYLRQSVLVDFNITMRSAICFEPH